MTLISTAIAKVQGRAIASSGVQIVEVTWNVDLVSIPSTEVKYTNLMDRVSSVSLAGL